MNTRRLLAALLAGVLVALGGQAGAGAHAILVTSTPADGATLDAAPPSLTLTFDEEVFGNRATAVLRTGGSTVPGVRATAGAGDKQVVVTLPVLENGAYALTWRVVSTDDAHSTSGTVAFGVGTGVTAAAGRDGSAPRVLNSALRWADLVATAVAFGAIALAAAGRRRMPGLDVTCARIARRGAVVATLCAAAVLVADAGVRQLGTVVTDTSFGRWWLLHVVGLILLAAARTRAIQGVAAMLTVIGVATGSHVAARHPVAGALLAVHLTAAGVWAGLVVLLAALALRSADRRALLRAAARPALGAALVVVGTGLALSARQVASVDALLSTAYGRILAIKVGLVTLAVLVGLWSARHLARRGVRLRMALEAALLVVVLAAAAALSEATPARGPAFAPTVHTASTPVATQLDDVFVTLDLSPNAVGQSFLRVTAANTRLPAPGPIQGIAVRLTAPDGAAQPTRQLVPTGSPGGWQLGGVALSSAGTWRIDLAIHRGNLPDTVLHTTWSVPGGPLGDRRPIISDRPWGTALDALAIGLLVAGVAGVAGTAGVTVLRRRRRRTAHAAPPDERELVGV